VIEKDSTIDIKAVLKVWIFILQFEDLELLGKTSFLLNALEQICEYPMSASQKMKGSIHNSTFLREKTLTLDKTMNEVVEGREYIIFRNLSRDSY
jgi:hypothetical protein